MFEEYLVKYENCGEFSFSTNEDLREKCNAPTNASGIYLVYNIGGNKEELIYIGASDKKILMATLNSGNLA